MSSALSLGELYVKLSAKTQGFGQQMSAASEAVEKTSKKLKAIGNDLGGAGLGLTAFAAGMLAAASQADAGVKGQLDSIKASFTALAVEISRAILPAVQEFSSGLRQLADWFAGLSPHAKVAISHFATFAVAAGAVAMGVGKVAGVVAALAEGFGAVLVPAVMGGMRALLAFNSAMAAQRTLDVGSVFGKMGGALKALPGLLMSGASSLVALLGPILAVAAAVAGIALAFGAVYRAWNDSSTGLKDTVMGWWESIKGFGQRVWDFFVRLADTIRGFFRDAALFVLDMWAGQVRAMAKLAAPIARFLKLDGTASFLEGLQSVTGKQLLEGMEAAGSVLVEKAKAGATIIANGAKAAASAVVDGIKYSAGGLQMAGQKVAGFLKGLLPGSNGGTADGGSARVLPEFKPAASAGMSELDVLKLGHVAALSPVLQAMQDAVVKREKERLELERQFEEERISAIRSAQDHLKSRFKSALGALGSLIDTFGEGTLAAGGNPLGGVAAVAAEMLSQSQGFKDTVATLTGVLQMVADALGVLFRPLQPLLGAISTVLRPVFTVLGQVLESVVDFVRPVIPILVLVGQVLGTLAPVIGMVARLFILVTNPLLLLAREAMPAVFEVLKTVGGFILAIVHALADAWNGIIGAVQGVLRALGGLEVFGAKPLDFLNDWAKNLDSAKVPLGGLEAGMDALAGLTWEQAQAIAAEEAARLTNIDALNAATEALTNVPSGYRVALARYNAQDPRDAGGGAPPSSTPSSGGTGSGDATAPSEGGGTVIHVHPSQGMDEEALAELVADKVERRRRRNLGNATVGGRFASAF